MKKVFAIMAVISLVLITGQVMAEQVATPASYQGITVVDADWVKANLDKVKVFDARKKGEYVERHIPGAILAYYNDKSEKTLDFDESQDKWDMSVYPQDRNTPIVVYCNGPACWKSFKSAIRLVKSGYTNVHWLRDGFPGWSDKGYPTE